MNIRRRIITVILAVITLFISLGNGINKITVGALGVSAYSAVLIEAESGKVIFEKNSNVRRGMASTTKIMTALVAIENAPLDMKIRIPKEAVGIEGSSLYLTENEEMTLEELLYALMLRSANDAATAIAIVIGGSVDGFADMMNERAHDMGLKDTHFTNPHGLDSDNHYTTAEELGKIATEAIKNPVFAKIVSTFSTTLSQNGQPDRRVVVNHNRLLKSYDGCIGVKTGFTKKCGRCLVSAASRDGVTLVAVTLNAPDDWRDHKMMLDYGFSELESVKLDGELSGATSVVGGVGNSVAYESNGSVTLTLPKKRSEIRKVVEMSRFYYAPIKDGDVLGRVVYYDGKNEIASFNIVAKGSVIKPKKKRSFISWLISFFD